MFSLGRHCLIDKESTLIDGIFAINPTVHAYNLRDDNLRSNVVSEGFRRTLWGLHSVWNPPEYQVPIDLYYSDWSAELLAETLFLESNVDLAGNPSRWLVTNTRADATAHRPGSHQPCDRDGSTREPAPWSISQLLRPDQQRVATHPRRLSHPGLAAFRTRGPIRPPCRHERSVGDDGYLRETDFRPQS